MAGVAAMLSRTMATVRALSRASLIAVLLLPGLGLRAQAQNMAAFAALAQRCRSSGAASTCRAALEQSHRLRNWAEARKLWRCYSALLGAEAEMIAASRPPGRHQRDAPAFLEMRRACGR